MRKPTIPVTDLVKAHALRRLSPRQVLLVFAGANDLNGIAGVADQIGATRQYLSRCLRHYEPGAHLVDTRPLSHEAADRIRDLTGWAPTNLRRSSEQPRTSQEDAA